jgi:DNA-3-methyladenine glycosylase II
LPQPQGEVVLTQTLNFHRLPRLSDDDVIRQLTQVKGIGRWTAEMYLIFVLCRPDVLPLDDSALSSAIADSYRLKEKTDAATIAAIGDAWRPFRTVASWYLWSQRNLDSRGTRVRDFHQSGATPAVNPRESGEKLHEQRDRQHF